MKTKNQTVKSLRQNGWKVRVIHNRPKDNAGNPSQYGGRTVVEVTSPEGLEASGAAYCALGDTYNKKLGVRIALGRALKVI